MISQMVMSLPDTMKAFARTRSRKELLSIHMKFILLVIIGALLWNNNSARQFTSESFNSLAEFIEPETESKPYEGIWPVPN